MQATSDEVLIGRIAQGDRLAMQVLFARHHVRVYRFVLRMVRNEATAEDLISEVFSRRLAAGRQIRRARGGLDLALEHRPFQSAVGAAAARRGGTGR
jgi:DNA-directed RNA polymerase specialized sigma24 family protein